MQPAFKQDEQKTLTSTNPARGFEVLGHVDITSDAEVGKAVAQARETQKSWQDLSIEQRVNYVRGLNQIFKDHRDELIKKTSEEMGQPLGLSTSIVDGGLNNIDWHCDNAAECLKTKILFEDDHEVNAVAYEPYGVIACIVAWNFPFGNFAGSVSQAILAGNTIVMKYSEEVPLFSKFVESLIEQSNLPKGVVSFIYGDGMTGAALMDEKVDFLSFTGSSRTGQKLYQKAAEKLIPVTLELGGSSPGIVFADCTIDDQLVENIFWKRFLNTGQFCNNLKRLIVHHSLMDELTERLVAYAKLRTIGDPLDPNTDMGPLVAERQVTQLEGQVQDAIDKGATMHCGGKRPDGLTGAYYEPTIFTNITKDMRIWAEEVFGPALPIISFDTYDEAIEMGNDTEYGLTASIFTNDQDIRVKAMRDLKAGSIDQNLAHYYRAIVPFGGYKASGIGRQGGAFGFHDVCEVKTLAYQK